MGNQKELRFETLKIRKPGGGHKKINSKEKFSLYLIAFSLTTNQYLYSNFEDLFFN